MAKNKKKKGVKGYVVGGSVKGFVEPEKEEQEVIEKEKQDGIFKAIKSGASLPELGQAAVASGSDVLRTGAKGALSVVGAGGAIDSSKARTKGGERAAQAADVAGNIVGEAAEVGLNFVVPGSGTALGVGRTALTSGIGEDENLSDSAKKAKNVANITSGVAGSVVGGLGGAQGISSIASGIGSSLATNKIKRESKGGLDPLGNKVSLNPNPLEKEEGLPNLTGLSPNTFAKGGKISGKGTAKSDSISMKAEDDGFIVPAENAKLAENIRSEVFGKNEKAPLKSGDTDIKVSDGEHYFTKKEKDVLTDLGVDLNKLAPDARPGDKLARGGSIASEKAKDKFDPDKSKSLTPVERISVLDDIREGEIASKASKNSLTPQGTSKTKTDAITEVNVTDDSLNLKGSNRTGSGLADSIGGGGFDTGKAVSLAQIAAGSISLATDGPAPEFEAGTAPTAKERTEVGFGYTSAEKAALNRNIEKQRAVDSKLAQEISGGSVGLQLAAQGASSQRALDARSNVALDSENIRLNKQKIEDARFSGDRAFETSRFRDAENRRRQVFEDSQTRFNQKQESGAALLSSGITNLIGSDRFSIEQKNINRRAEERARTGTEGTVALTPEEEARRKQLAGTK